MKKDISKQQGCVHDWAFNEGRYPTIRQCLLCGRDEKRDYIGTSWSDIAFSNWYVKLPTK